MARFAYLLALTVAVCAYNVQAAPAGFMKRGSPVKVTETPTNVALYATRTAAPAAIVTADLAQCPPVESVTVTVTADAAIATADLNNAENVNNADVDAVDIEGDAAELARARAEASDLDVIIDALQTAADAELARADQEAQDRAAIDAALQAAEQAQDQNEIDRLQAEQAALDAEAQAGADADALVKDCNIARFRIVRGLSKTAGLIDDAIVAAGDDAAAVAELQPAADGIAAAQAGVSIIAAALAAQEAPPADAREDVDAGIGAAIAALTASTSADPAVVAAVGDAQVEIGKSGAAARDVVAFCV